MKDQAFDVPSVIQHKFDWLTNYLVGGQPLTWWLVFDIVGCWLLKLLAG
jgi:hypothetical protein